MSENWPYFKVNKSSITLFPTKEDVENSLRAGYVMTDDPDEDLLANFGNNPQRTRNKYMKERLQRHLDALDAHTEEYIRLYNLQFTINNFYAKKDPADENSEEFLPAKANIDIDDSSNPKMTVEMFAPIGADLIVDDETATFDPKGLSVPRMKAIIDLACRHNMVSDINAFELENCDADLKNMLEKAKEELIKEHREPVTGGMSGEEDKPVSDADFEKAKDEKKQQPQPSDNKNSNEPQRDPKAEKEMLDKANKLFENWLNKNKIKNNTWFLGHDFSGGWTTFTVYSSESDDPFRKPVEKTRRGDIKYNYELEIKTRIRNGRLEIEFSVPYGKNLNEDQAANIAAAFKAAGVKRITFDGLTDGNEAAMRLGCAAKGVIPINHNINFEKYDKMINMAGVKMDKNSPDFYQYQYDLAIQVGERLKGKGIDWNDEKNKNNPECRRIRWAVGAYKRHPFRDLWEDSGLRDSYEQKIDICTVAKGTKAYSDAAYAVGAKMAVYYLYQEFSQNALSPISVFLDGKSGSLNEREKLVLANALQRSNISLDTTMRNVPPHVFLELYEEMFKTQHENAKRDLEYNYVEALTSANKYGSKDNPEYIAIRKCASNAEVFMRNMKKELAEFQLPEIGLKDPNEYNYDFKPAYEKAVADGLIDENAGRKGRRYNRNSTSQDDGR